MTYATEAVLHPLFSSGLEKNLNVIIRDLLNFAPLKMVKSGAFSFQSKDKVEKNKRLNIPTTKFQNLTLNP